MDYESQIEKKQGTTAIPQKHGAIEEKDLSFRYDGAGQDTLKRLHGKYAEMFTCQAKYYQDQEMLAAE